MVVNTPPGVGQPVPIASFVSPDRQVLNEKSPVAVGVNRNHCGLKIVSCALCAALLKTLWLVADPWVELMTLSPYAAFAAFTQIPIGGAVTTTGTVLPRPEPPTTT